MLAAALVAALALAPAASAEGGSTTRDGRTLSVSKAVDLRPAGETVTVTGKGYDTSKGIYVAFCVDNGPGRVPTPCGGGADTEGSSGNSVWISDFPPAYGTGLARPYGDGGTFEVQISVRAQLRADDPETAEDEAVDCRTTRCAVVTRNDHTRSDDRGQDVTVPIRFAASSTGAAPAPSRPGTAAGGGSAPAAAGAPAPAASTGATVGPAATPLVSGSAAPSAGAASPGAAPTQAAVPGVAEPAPAAALAGGSAAPAAATSGDGSAARLLVPLALLAVAAAVAVALRRRVRGRAH